MSEIELEIKPNELAEFIHKLMKSPCRFISFSKRPEQAWVEIRGNEEDLVFFIRNWRILHK